MVTSWLVERALLCATNEGVDGINAPLLNDLDGINAPLLNDVDGINITLSIAITSVDQTSVGNTEQAARDGVDQQGAQRVGRR